MLEKDDPLAAESTSEQDEYRTGLKRFTWFGGFDGFADLQSTKTVISKVGLLIL